MLHRRLPRLPAQALLAALPVLAAAGLSLAARPARAEAPRDDRAVVEALRAGGVAVFVRHARTTPGVGDPPGWRLEDCSTQRNLDAEGRAQARRLGAWFVKRRIAPTVVRNSPWCRTRETARLAFGRTQDWPALANLFENRGPEKENVEQVHRYIGQIGKREVAVLVSHGSSIRAFAGESLDQGEALVVRGERAAGGAVRLVVVGRIAVP